MAKLGDMLVSEHLVTPAQLEAAVAAQGREGGFLGSILVAHGALAEPKLVEALARQTGASAVDLERTPLDPKLASLVAEPMAKKLFCAPVKLTGHVLHVAMADPTDDAAIEQLSFRTGKTVKALATAASALPRAWKKLYAGSPAAEAYANLDKVLSSAIDDVKVLENKEEEKIDDLKLAADDPPIVKLVNGILLKAIEMRASDIHLEPLEDGYRVRYRIDGVMHVMMDLPPAARTNVASRIKIVSHMDIAERRLPQDGRMKVALGARGTYDFRVSCLPSVHGEKIVIRILGTGSLKKSIEELGFRGKALQDVQSAIQNPYGMILVTGPTGSGKTTTLYTMLSVLNTPDVNIVTAEDPVEYNLRGLTQVAVKPHIGYTFDMALRAFLRQDPDVILVGEMRDYETAAIAVKAALTGHLVLSTIHTNDAPSTVVRLVDMGIEPYLVSSAVKLVVAQRLVRRICPACREEVRMSEADRRNLAESTAGAISRVYRGKGCAECSNIGYKGRLPVYEVMPVRSRDMKRVITEGGTEVQVAQVARKEDLRTLKDDVLELLNAGETTLEEAFAILLSE